MKTKRLNELMKQYHSFSLKSLSFFILSKYKRIIYFGTFSIGSFCDFVSLSVLTASYYGAFRSFQVVTLLTLTLFLIPITHLLIQLLTLLLPIQPFLHHPRYPLLLDHLPIPPPLHQYLINHLPLQPKVEPYLKNKQKKVHY